MRKLLISLDELLDTRLAIIAKHNHGLVAKWMELKDQSPYHLRKTDRVLWSSLGWREATWIDKYLLRNKETLKDAILTHAIKLILECWEDYLADDSEKSTEKELHVDINLHPYILDEEELITLENILIEYIPIASQLRFVNYNESHLTPEFLRDNYKYIIMYDFYQWTKVYGKRLKELYCPTLTFVVPRLFNEEPDMNIVNQNKFMKQLWSMDVFLVFENALQARLGIRFVDVRYFTPILVDFTPRFDQLSPVDEAEMDKIAEQRLGD